MVILDTNVISEVMQQSPDKRVVEWIDRQPQSSIWTTSITVLEIRLGLGLLPSGRRQRSLIEAFESTLEAMKQRVLAFDTEGAEQASELMAARQKAGRRGDLRDTMIAGIVLAHRATLATRNISHFEDLSVPVINPWQQ